MANKKVTDLTAITTAPASGVMHFIDTTDTSQNAAGSSFKVTKADLLKENTAAIFLNTAKIGITPAQATDITNNTAKVGYTDTLVAAAPSVVLNTAKVGITPSQASAITANTSKVGFTDALVSTAPSVVANTAKVGISPAQSSAITVNTSKVGYTDALVATAPTVVANTAKVGITPTQASAITANTAKVGYTDALVASAPSVVLNTAKVGITTGQSSAITANTSGLAAALISINNNINNACSKYVADFTNRVLVDGGVLESLNNLTINLRLLYSSTFFNKISFLFLPAGTKAGKAYSLLPEDGTGFLTVVRNTTATRVNSSGLIEIVLANVPRLNYDSVGGNPILLVEGQRTNLSLYSSDFDNAYWSKTNSTIFANNSISPDGTQNADTLTFNSNSNSFIQAVISGSFGNATHTISVFAKVLTGTAKFRLKCTHGGVIDYFSNDLTATTEFQRFTFTQAFTSGGSGIIPGIVNEVSGGAKNLIIFGLQLETASSASSYIPTVASAITRNADAITRTPPTGTVKIITTFSDDTTQVLTTIPLTYTVPEGLIKSITMNNIV